MKERLDMLLIKRGLFPSRAKAQAVILAGEVKVDGEVLDKPGRDVEEDIVIEIKEKPRYVSRGGEKLEQALIEFKIKVKGKVCLDVGASTGGFTDCLLQNGAKKVFCVDVGHGQLDWKLQQDERVERIDKTNARYLKPKQFPAELAVVDVSFISLSKILPAVFDQLEAGGEVLALIKPQFEAGREQVPRGGVIRDKKVHAKVIEKVKAEAKGIGFSVLGITQSTTPGADGNIEHFIFLRKQKPSPQAPLPEGEGS